MMETPITRKHLINNGYTAMEEEDLICINISGVLYETLITTVEKFPNTLLGNKERREKYFVPTDNCYYFPTNPLAFDAILYYYQNGGVMVRPEIVPMPLFESDLSFFGMPEQVIAGLREKEGYVSRELPMPKRAWQRRIWLMFEVPDSSWEARVIAVWSITVITVSIVTFCMETMPYFQRHAHSASSSSSSSNSSITIEVDTFSYSNTPRSVYLEIPSKCIFLIIIRKAVSTLNQIPSKSVSFYTKDL